MYYLWSCVFLSFLVFFDLSAASGRCTRSRVNKLGIAPTSMKKSTEEADISAIFHRELEAGNTDFFEKLCTNERMFLGLLNKGFRNAQSILMNRNDLGETPLHVAVRIGNSSIALKIIELMVRYQEINDQKVVDLIRKNSEGISYQKQKRKIAESYMWSISSARDDFQKIGQDLAFLHAHKKTLEEHKVDFNNLNLNEETPLDVAMKLGLHAVTMELIKITIGDRLGEMLFCALFAKDVVRALELIRYGGHIGAKTRWLQNNCLHTAIERSLPAVVDALLASKEANELINESNVDLNTPIYLAISKYKTDLVFKLVQHGASLKHQNYKGLTPSQFARECNLYWLASELEKLETSNQAA